MVSLHHVPLHFRSLSCKPCIVLNTHGITSGNEIEGWREGLKSRKLAEGNVNSGKKPANRELDENNGTKEWNWEERRE